MQVAFQKENKSEHTTVKEEIIQYLLCICFMPDTIVSTSYGALCIFLNLDVEYPFQDWVLTPGHT